MRGRTTDEDYGDFWWGLLRSGRCYWVEQSENEMPWWSYVLWCRRVLYMAGCRHKRMHISLFGYIIIVQYQKWLMFLQFQFVALRNTHFLPPSLPFVLDVIWLVVSYEKYYTTIYRCFNHSALCTLQWRHCVHTARSGTHRTQSCKTCEVDLSLSSRDRCIQVERSSVRVLFSSWHITLFWEDDSLTCKNQQKTHKNKQQNNNTRAQCQAIVNIPLALMKRSSTYFHVVWVLLYCCCWSNNIIMDMQSQSIIIIYVLD